MTATAILEYLSPNYAAAQQVRAGDPRLDSEYVEYESPKGRGTIRGLLSTPAGNRPNRWRVPHHLGRVLTGTPAKANSPA